MGDERPERPKKKKSVSPFKKQPPREPPLPPVSGVRSAEATRALEQVERVLEVIEATGRKDVAFLQSVAASVRSVGQTIEKSNRVSARQRSALDNWEKAVKRWKR